MRNLPTFLKSEIHLPGGINIWLISILLILRVPFVAITRFLFGPSLALISLGYEFVTYFLIILLIWINQDDLEKFNIDRSSIIIAVIFSSFLRIRLPTEKAYPFITYTFWGISLTLIIILARQWTKLRWVRIRWGFAGTIVGLGLVYSAIQIWGMRFENINQWDEFESAGFFSTYIINIIYHLGHNAIREEIIFRGFLWGILRDKGWNDPKIWLFQALLFFIAHLYYYENILGWIFILFIGLVMGWLAWRSRSISPGLIAHAIYNGYYF